MDTQNSLYQETQERIPDTMTVEADPLKLELEDKDLVRVIDDRIKKAEDFYQTKNLKDRREKNKKYLFGDQIDPGQLKYYNARYVDNLVYEAEKTIKPIALSRLPDLLVKPGNDTDDSKNTAKELTDIINNDLRKRANRKVLGLAFKHHPVYFVGAVKAVWDSKMGEDGDYRFKVIHPENLVLDHTASTNDPDAMDFIAEAGEYSVKEILMMFPDKEKEFLDAVRIGNFGGGDVIGDEKKLASKIKIWEVWFTWYKSSTDQNEKKWERIEGVVWKYKTVVLGKMKNPYWDYRGERRMFKASPGGPQEPTEDEMRQAMFGEDMQTQQVFSNYFSMPKKPYIFIGYDQWGEQPLDETSRIEQVLYLQDNVNKRGKQISEMNDRARGKHVFSTESGLTKTDIENMDMDNPDEDIVVDGDISKTHSFIQGTLAPAGLYQEQNLERNKVFSKMGTHATTRGEREPANETATGRQIMREADFGMIDDLVEDTINDAAEQMAGWAMQFIKLFYTKEHIRRMVGADGAIVFSKLNRDLIEDGMEVVVSASGVDKMRAKQEAYQRAELQMSDPLSFYTDVGASDPLGRTEKLMTFKMAPDLYVQKYVKKLDSQGMVEALGREPVNGQSVQVPEGQPMTGGGINGT